MTDSKRSITDVAAGDRRGEWESARVVRMETRANWADLRGCKKERGSKRQLQIGSVQA